MRMEDTIYEISNSIENKHSSEIIMLHANGKYI